MIQRMQPIWTTITIIILLTVSKAMSFRVLGLFPHPGLSHFHIFHPIMRGLADAGHHVTVVSHFPDKSPPAHYHDLPLTGTDTLTNSVDLQFFENRRIYNHFLEFFLLHEWGRQSCELALKSPVIPTILKKKFDVIIMEQFNTDCMMGLAHIIGAPVIALSSCALMPWHYARIGNPHIPSYIPALFMGHSEDMNFFQRVANWIAVHGMIFLYRQYSEKTTTEILRKRFGSDMPDVGELVKETSLIFVNQHYSLSGAKPLSPAVIEIGGVHIQKPKPLDIEILRILDASEHGAIYISWGSMIRAETLPAEKREAILKAVGRLKQTVLWKWENETLPNITSNVHIYKWMPQREILCHPKMKVFMTHGGLLGSSEAAYCGVPVVVTPMYGDQFLNAAALIHRGMGALLHYEDITETNVFKAVKKALESKSIENAKAVSYSFRNRPKKAVDTAIWWVEHVVKSEGSPFTKSVSTYMPAYAYHSLDVHAFFILILAICTGSWFWICHIFCFKRKPLEKEKKH